MHSKLNTHAISLAAINGGGGFISHHTQPFFSPQNRSSKPTALSFQNSFVSKESDPVLKPTLQNDQTHNFSTFKKVKKPIAITYQDSDSDFDKILTQ